MLPIVDNFERAAQSLKPQTEGEAAVQQQYKAVQESLVQALRQYGVEEIPCEVSVWWGVQEEGEGEGLSVRGH